MRVTILRSYFDTGVRVFHPGEVVDLNDEHARALIHHAIAAPIAPVAVIPPVITPIETASAPRKRKRERPDNVELQGHRTASSRTRDFGYGEEASPS
jgi:hypothetical protein